MQVLTLVSDDDLAEADADLARAIEDEQSSRHMAEAVEDELAKLDFAADEADDNLENAPGPSLASAPVLPGDVARGSVLFLAGAAASLTVQAFVRLLPL